VGDLGYADASDELDAIIAELEGGVIDVDLLEVRLRRAVEIVEELDRRIRGARDRVGSLLPRLEAVARTRLARTRAGSAPTPNLTRGHIQESEGCGASVQSSRALMAHQPLLERGASFAEALALTPS